MRTLLEIGLSNAVAATLLALVVVVGSWLCRHRTVTHVLWLLVLMKLLTPPLLRIPIAWEGTENAAASAAVAAAAVNVPAPALPPLDRTTLLAQIDALEQSALMTAEQPPALGLAEGIVLVWLAGSAVWFIWTGVYLVRFRRLLRHAAAAPSALQARVAELARRVGVRPPNLALVPGHVSPMVWALFGRARLLFPARLLDCVTDAQRDTLILHELAHLARRDHWVRWLELAAGGLYWWLPVVWLARRGLHAAEEECCDACVTQTLPDSGHDYALALVQTVTFLSPARTALPVVASGVGPVPQIKRRLTMILRGHPSLSRLGGGLVLGLALALLPWAPTWAQQAKEPQPSAQQLRQQQIEVLRQLLKTLEDQQKADDRALQLRAVERERALHDYTAALRMARLQLAEEINRKALAAQEAESAKARLAAAKASVQKAHVDVKDADAQAKEIQQLKVQIEEAKAHLQAAEARLRLLQAALEKAAAYPLPKTGAGSNPGADTISYLRKRIEDLDQQLKAKNLGPNEVKRLQDERAVVEQLLKRLSTPGPQNRSAAPHEAPKGTGNVEAIRLQASDAVGVAQALEQIFNASAGKEQPAERPARVRIVAEPVSNSILIQGSADDLRIIRGLLEKGLDTGSSKR